MECVSSSIRAKLVVAIRDGIGLLSLKRCFAVLWIQIGISRLNLPATDVPRSIVSLKSHQDPPDCKLFNVKGY